MNNQMARVKSTVNDIYNVIDEIAPFSSQMSFDNSGFLVGNIRSEVETALIVLDISRAAVDEAERIGAQLIISHHPVIFNPAKKVVAGTALYELIKSGISAVCAHTNLDLCPLIGVNRALSDSLELVNFTRADDSECMFTAELKKPVTAEQLAQLIKKKLNAPYLTYTKTKNEKLIKKIGFCSGSGGEFVFDAVESCDAYLTGEARHHELLFAVENDFPLFVAGHYATEKVFAAPLKKYLEEKITGVKFVISESEADPCVIQNKVI